jgi:hypothetical protein
VQFDVRRIVGAPPVAVFSVVSDIRTWPLFIQAVAGIEMLTRGRLRVGTRFRAQRVMFGRETTEVLEVAELERPLRLRLASDSPDLYYERDYVIDALEVGSRLTLIFRTRPTSLAGKGVLPFKAPFLEITLRDELERDLNDLALAVQLRTAARTG